MNGVATTSLCPACGGLARFPLRFCQPCRDSGADSRWHAQNQPRPQEHAPGHPIGAQPGPGGIHARWCKRDDCEWRDTVGGTR